MCDSTQDTNHPCPLQFTTTTTTTMYIAHSSLPIPFSKYDILFIFPPFLSAICIFVPFSYIPRCCIKVKQIARFMPFFLYQSNKAALLFTRCDETQPASKTPLTSSWMTRSCRMESCTISAQWQGVTLPYQIARWPLWVYRTTLPANACPENIIVNIYIYIYISILFLQKKTAPNFFTS